ncbi:hypothetical protein VTN02DRAFT_2541 [Thermoascus thermophilus]
MPTEAAHIIPFCLGSFSTETRHENAKIWDVLYRCFPDLENRLAFNHHKINDPINAITLIPNLHAEFGAFHMALEPTRMSTTSKHTPTSQSSTKISSCLCRDAWNSDLKIQPSPSLAACCWRPMQSSPKSSTPPGKARKLRRWLIEKRT